MMKTIANILFRLADAVVLPVGRSGDFFQKR